MQFQNKISKYFLPILIIGLVANLLALCNNILEPDGALYASIAKYIAKNNDWVNLYGNGDDWLDKPHFPFWAAALSYKIFGINEFAYKFPSLLIFLLGCYYTYKFTQQIYCTQTAQIATLIYITSLHVILSNFDVRAEGYLTAFVIASLYHIYKASRQKWFIHVLAAAVYTACAIMTKGIFVLITIGSGYLFYWLISKQFKQFLNYKWYVYVLLSFVFITPELYCLYKQFDLHPEKIVFGTTHVSGIKFFFWDSQFGRFFNTGPIQGEGDLFFFLHTTLWAFLPWSLYLVFATTKGIKNIKKIPADKSLIIKLSAITSFILFSVSKFQLPHYIVIIFPLFSALVARYLLCSSTSVKNIKLIQIIQYVIFTILLIIIGLLIVLFKINQPVLIISITIIGIILFLLFNKKTLFNVIVRGILFSSLLSVILNVFFYPQLMQYQAGMIAGKWQQTNLPNAIIPMFRCNEYSFEFCGNTTLKRENYLAETLLNKSSSLLFTSFSECKKINADSFNVKHLQVFPYFHVSQITPDFFNAATRKKVLDSFIIIEVSKKY